MRASKPDIKIIGEVWLEPESLSSLFKGLPSLFNFKLSRMIVDVVNSGHAAHFTDEYQRMLHAYEKPGTAYHDAILLSNHDMNRIRSQVHGDMDKAKLAASILFTLPGDVYLYYGEEIGMTGHKPDEQIREPFLWGDNNFQNKIWLESVHSVPPAVTPLIDQLVDENSIYHHYKYWIALRKKHPVLAEGKWMIESSYGEGLIAYKMSGDGKEYTVIHNLTGNARELAAPVRATLLTENKAQLEENRLTLPGFTSAVFVNR
jgi:glycosidase